MTRLKHLLTASFFALALLPYAAPGNVNFSITDNDATPTSTSVTKGGSFPFTLNLSTTASEQTTAVDYFLQSSTAGIFTIASRATNTSAYPDPYTSDSAITQAASGPGLNPRNSTDLGGGVTNTNTPTSGAGPFKVADFVLSVSPAAPVGTYTITTFTNTGQGWVGPGPTFSDNSISSQGSFTVTVTPEPSGAAAAGLTLLGLVRRRGRARGVLTPRAGG